MILVIRISGLVEIPPKVKETLFRMRLRRKYSAVLLENTPETHSRLQLVRNFVAYGVIDADTLRELITKRAEGIAGKKVNAETVLAQLEKKDLESLGVKPYFRLHSPRGGIESKVHFGTRKGVLGDNKEHINALVRRML